MKKIFLGGTCTSNWRIEAIKYCRKYNFDYFDPVVDDWNAEAQKREEFEKGHCDFCLYCITPKMAGVYSIAEVVDDSNKRPKKTVLVILPEDEGEKFTESQLKSLNAVAAMVKRNGAYVFWSLEGAIYFLSTEIN